MATITARLIPLNSEKSLFSSPYKTLILIRKSFPTLAEFKLDGASSFKGALEETSYISKLEITTLSQLEVFLTKAYTESVGVEFDHVLSSEEREWLYNEYEKIMATEVTKDEKKKILKLLTEGEAVDHFISKKFPTFKRYSGEGTESLLVSLNTIFAGASEQGISDIVLAMPHRGRFNVLIDLLDYPAAELFRKIAGKNDLPADYYTGIDDVTSHVAASARRAYSRGTSQGSQEINVSMLHNPSHLEAVNPVSMGKARAKQDEIQDINKILNVQLHGDAAFAGQGVIYESFAISRAPSYNINGTVHIICNNQIGFTTVPREGRSTQYSSDIVKAFGVPVIHVNADRPEEVLKVSELALKYRQKFNKDFMIDLIGTQVLILSKSYPNRLQKTWP